MIKALSMVSQGGAWGIGVDIQVLQSWARVKPMCSREQRTLVS